MHQKYMKYLLLGKMIHSNSTMVGEIGFGESKTALSKSQFVNLLCRIWHQGMPAQNAISGFRATGVCPVDPSKYPVDRLDKRKLKEYNKWVADGKPEDQDPANSESNNVDGETTPANAVNDTMGKQHKQMPRMTLWENNTSKCRE